MIFIINDDSILYITKFINFNDILNLSITCKYLFLLFDEIFYKNLAIKYFSNEFWKLAKLRPPYKSLPLENFKQELIRIENFQTKLDFLNVNRWCQKDFYNYWAFND